MPKNTLMMLPTMMSTTMKNVAAMATSTSTMTVDTMVSLRVGQVTLEASERTSRTNFAGFILSFNFLK